MSVFIDDYSIFTWAYFVKYKPEAFNKFPEFKELVERVLGSKIMLLKINNGDEYTSE